MTDVAAEASSSSSSSNPSFATTSISPSFKWSSKYDDQLQHIAETDELPSDEETYNWSDLKDAIKYKIQLTLQDSFVDVPSPILHPSVARVMQNSKQAAGAEGEEGDNSFGSNGSGGSSNGSDETVQASKVASSSRDDSGKVDEDEDVNMSIEGDDSNERSTPSLTTSSSDEEEEADKQANSSSIAQEGLAPTSSSVSISESSLYPAKTKAPAERKGNWGRVLNIDETKEEMELVFGMLDEFESSPPFTIQRLSELLLSPKDYVRSRPKYLSSLMRLLSITASHSDFPPVSPGQPPLVTNMNGGGMSKGGSFGPPSPSSEPLFSPIPFLQKKDRDSSTEIPDLDLDSTTTTTANHVPSPSKPVVTSSSSSGSAGAIGSNPITQPLGIPLGQVDELETTNGDNDSSTQNGDGHQMDGNVHPLTSTTTSATTTTATDDDEEKDQEEDTTRSSKKLRSKSPFRGEQNNADEMIDEQEQ